jgi:hypothetical protein
VAFTTLAKHGDRDERVSILRIQAIDQSLTEKQMAELRKLSSRAEITATCFCNELSLPGLWLASGQRSRRL